MIYFGDPVVTIIDYGFPESMAVTAHLTNTGVLQLPVNCVLDGQQREPVSKLMGLNGAIRGPLRGIFDE